MQLTKGYKQTEVGVIPDDWIIVLGSDLTDRISKGASPRWQGFDYTDSGLLFVTSENVRDGFLDISKPKYLPIEFNEKIKRSQIQTNDILINLVGASIGRSCLVKKDLGIANVNQAVSVFRVKENYSSEFVSFYLQDTETKQRIIGLQVDLARENISLTNLRDFKIPLPHTKAEQEAIAGALSDADAWIESLEQLIAKKRRIKAGSMQALLTGKQRLPGFSGEWEMKTLGKLANVKTGSRNNQDKIHNGKYPFYVRSATVERINSYSHDCEAILIPGEGGIGSIFHYINGRFDVHQRVYAITQFGESVSGKYVYLYMAEHFGSHAMEHSVKATVDSLRLPTFQNFEITLPSALAEQTAIAAILTDMDTELDAWEAKLSKARQIKQGMMQELLTGKTRLI